MSTDRGAVFAVDIGGTKTAFACFDGAGKELFYGVFATEPEAGAQSLAERVFEKAAEAVGRYKIARGVIASPGPLCCERGTIVNAVTMGWKNVPIAATFAQKFGFPFLLINDCDAGALGVWHACGYRHCKTLVYMSVSTGIGGGIVHDGTLFTGSGNAANFGHVPVGADERLLCGCGNVNCLELFASGSGIEKRYLAAAGKSLSCAEIAAAAREGDETAGRIFRTAGEKIAFALQGVVAVIAPDAVVFGGSVCKSRDLFLPYVCDRLPETPVFLAPESGKQVLYGAAYYAVNQ